jgi:hypothetical protein
MLNSVKRMLVVILARNIPVEMVGIELSLQVC